MIDPLDFFRYDCINEYWEFLLLLDSNYYYSCISITTSDVNFLSLDTGSVLNVDVINKHQTPQKYWLHGKIKISQKIILFGFHFRLQEQKMFFTPPYQSPSQKISKFQFYFKIKGQLISTLQSLLYEKEALQINYFRYVRTY